MGGGPSLPVLPDQDSIANPGTKVVLSDDLSSVTDFSTFFESLVEQLQNPLNPMLEFAVKSKEITEHGSPDEFTIKIILDSQKLSAVGVGKSENPDPMAVWQRVTVDRAAGKFVVRVLFLPSEAPSESEDKPLLTYYTTVNRDPFRIESYSESLDGDGNIVRACDEGTCKGLQFTCNPVYVLLQDQKVKVKADMPSRSDPSKTAVLSDPLDAETSMDYIVDKFWEVMASSVPQESERLKVLSQTAEEVKYVFGETTMTLSYDKAGREVEGIQSRGGDPIGRVVYTFHADPLQLEAWSEDPNAGTRNSGPSLARTTSVTLNKAIVAAQSWFW